MKYQSQSVPFLPWQPTSWPVANLDFRIFLLDLEVILKETILVEIKNVIADATKANGSLERRGHVVALSLLCAVDTLSSYAFEDVETKICEKCERGDKIGPRYQKYIESFFPDTYKPHAFDLYMLYRNTMVHSWHLFKVSITPENEPIGLNGGVLSFGLLYFFDGLEYSVKQFIERLQSDQALQKSVLKRYESLWLSAK